MLPSDVHLEEGLQVEILRCSPEADFLLRESATAISAVAGLPDDLSINHDYYLYGLPKQQPRRGRWISDQELEAEMTERQASDYTERLAQFATETRNLPGDWSPQL